MTIDDALQVTADILKRGRDVELRSVSGGVIVYELNKRVCRPPGLNETPDNGDRT